IPPQNLLHRLHVEPEAVVANMPRRLSRQKLRPDALKPSQGAGIVLGDPVAGPCAELVAKIESVAEHEPGQPPICFDVGNHVTLAEGSHVDHDSGAHAPGVSPHASLPKPGLDV